MGHSPWGREESDTTERLHFPFSFFKFYFIFKLYKIVLVLPNIKMNPPQVYMDVPQFAEPLSAEGHFGCSQFGGYYK